MKNKDIHQGLSQAEIRDFLANAYERSWTLGTVSSLEKQIEELQAQLIVAKKHAAASQLVEHQGWETWDISDEVPYNSSTYFPFVGTEEEYNVLLEAIKSEG
jgi:hypothetical protein